MSKRSFAKSAALSLLLIGTAASPSHADILILVDKPLQQMTVYVDGDPRYRWPVSTGAEGYATPAGAFSPFRLEEDHYSREWDDAPMPHSIFFTDRGHAIHGSNHVKKLGTPASHGCVRLSKENAAHLFKMVEAEGLKNTHIEIMGTDVENDDWWPPVEASAEPALTPFGQFAEWLEDRRSRR